MTERFFKKDGIHRHAYIGPESEGDKLLADGWIEVTSLDLSTAEWVAQKVAETKAEAKHRIIAVFPGANAENYRDKELTALMRATRILKKGGTATTKEIADLDALDAMGAKLEAIIAASDLIEADIAASTDPANFDVVNSPRWPA